MLSQNWTASWLNVWLRPRLPLGYSRSFVVGSNQRGSKPLYFRASLYV